MTDSRPLIGPDGEVREITMDDLKHARRGRPPMLPGERKVRRNFMIDPDLAERLESVGNKSAFVNEAIRKALAG